MYVNVVGLGTLATVKVPVAARPPEDLTDWPATRPCGPRS